MNGIGIWMEYNEIEPLWGSLWNEAWNGATTKKFRELRRKPRAHIGHGLRTRMNSMRSNLSLFLSSSVVERSAVNWLVVGSNPTWGDLIHSEFFNSEWKGSLWPLRVGNPFPVSLFLLHSISSYQILFCDIWESPSIPRCRSGIILCSTVWVYLQLAN